MNDAPYESYDYLELGVDVPTFALAPEFGRVPPYQGPVSLEERLRAHGLIEEHIVISLHDHAVRFPDDMRETPAYNRTGRQHTAFAGTSQINGV